MKNEPEVIEGIELVSLLNCLIQNPASRLPTQFQTFISTPPNVPFVPFAAVWLVQGITCFGKRNLSQKRPKTCRHRSFLKVVAPYLMRGLAFLCDALRIAQPRIKCGATLIFQKRSGLLGSVPRSFTNLWDTDLLNPRPSFTQHISALKSTQTPNPS